MRIGGYDSAELVHSPFGGSVAARVLRCPASVDLIQKVPAYLRKPSAYADRGTACHAAIALLLAKDTHALVESLVGKTFGNYTITSDDVATAIGPAYAYVETLLDTPGAEYFLERRVVFPTIPDTWGTADLLVRIDRTMHVIDFKFGVGCAFARSPRTATKTSSTRSSRFTPRRRATRCPNSSPGSRASF